MKLTWAQVLGWRMARQGLLGRAGADDTVALAGRLGGLQAQVMSCAELTLWARVDDLPSDFVSGALWSDKTLVKTWAQRGTLHLVPAADYWRVQAATSTYTHFMRPSWSKAYGLAAGELERLVDAIGEALAGEPLTREALAAEVGERVGSPALGAALLGSWGSLLKPAAYRGLLCFGPGDGRNVRFTRPDVWLGGRREALDGDDSLLACVRELLGARGPLDRGDVARWWAITAAQAGRLLARLGDAGEAVEVDVEGRRGWLPDGEASRAVALDVPRGVVRLLPAFDQYVLGSTKHVEALLPKPGLRARVHRAQGWVSPVLLVDGRIEGVWRHERAGRALRVEVSLFRSRVPRAVRAGVAGEAERLARFLGGSLALRWA